jgi:hypothetical protein
MSGDTSLEGTNENISYDREKAPMSSLLPRSNYCARRDCWRLWSRANSAGAG